MIITPASDKRPLVQQPSAAATTHPAARGRRMPMSTINADPEVMCWMDDGTVYNM
jgi:hypothetical protein